MKSEPEMSIQSTLKACSTLALVAALSLAALPAAAQDRHDDRRDNNGNAVAAGALGFVLGAAVADSQEHRAYAQQHMSDNAWVSSCQSRYHSYDRDSGTYRARGGQRRYCH